MAFNYGNEEQGLSSLPENSHGKVVGEFSLNYPTDGLHCVKLMPSKPSGKLQCDYFAHPALTYRKFMYFTYIFYCTNKL